MDGIPVVGGAVEAPPQTVLHQTRMEPFPAKIQLGQPGQEGTHDSPLCALKFILLLAVQYIRFDLVTAGPWRLGL